MLFVLKSFINSLLYVKSNECRTALRKLQHSNPYNLLLAIIVKLLTDLRKIEQTAGCDFSVTASLKTTGFLCGNVGINRGNLTLTVRILSVKSGKYSLKNAVFTVNVKTRRKRQK